MRWARRHLDLQWPAGGPRWHLIVNRTPGELVGACRRAVLAPFELVPEIPADGRCKECDIRMSAAIDAHMTESPRSAAQATMGPSQRRELLALRAIRVSSRNAWQKAEDPDDRERIKDRFAELLGGLRTSPSKGWADTELRALMDEDRREVRE